jgi:hypothetical protein
MNNNTKLDINKAFSGEIEPLDMVLPGLLAGSVGSLVAPGSTGKGFFINSLLASMTAKNVIGMGITPQDCKVTYITAEDPLPILEHRICALGTLLNQIERQFFSDRVDIISLAGRQPSLLTDKTPIEIGPDGKQTTEARWRGWLEQICIGKRLVIIDTLRRFHSAEENDSGAMTILLQIIEGIAQRTGCAIIFTHHTKKGSTVNGLGLDADSSRGSGALIYNVRWQLNMQSMTQAEAENKYGKNETERRKYVQVFGSKINYDADGLQGWLMRGQDGILIEADLVEPPRTMNELKAIKGYK